MTSLVTLGPRLYRVDRGWATNEPDAPLTALTALAVGVDGLLHVLRRERPHLVSFDQQGRVVGRVDELDATDAHGLFAPEDGTLWIAARDHHMVLQITPEGEVLASIGDPEHPAPRGPLGHPARAVVAPDGEIYVADGYADALIHRFSADLTLLTSWGTPGLGPGQFRTPHSLWASKDRVIVADRDNDRLQIFDRRGALLAIWPDFLTPMDVFVDREGRIFVTEDVPRLSMWDASGTLLGRCRLPSLVCHGIAGDQAGNLYVVEARTNMVTRLTLLDIS